MKVIQLLPELKIGGVERGTIDLSLHLKRLGHESAVVSAGGILEAQLDNHKAQHFKLPIAGKNIQALIPVSYTHLTLPTKRIV